MHFGLVDFCQEMWKSIQDPCRKKELNKILGGGDTGQKTLGYAGATVA